ncbi:MAG: nucleotidyltransferase family protein [Deltaproteobacteria bacterium]|nr:nucleotidyltransferase family protein [Deltaproteobacteria bacterium]
MSRNLNNFRAMILAAGLGTRLRPLTHKTPKPLLPVNGRPMIDFSLARVKKAGITNVIINLHYLGGQIKKYVGSGRRYGLKIRYLHEPKILGTGGGIKNAERFLNGGPFVVINSDTLIDIDLKKVISYHAKKGGAATMVVRKLKCGEDYAKLNIAKNGRLKNFGSGKYMFCGVQILEPIIFKFLKKPSCLIESGYKKLLRARLPVYTFVHKGYWNDIGTLQRYKSGSGLTF